MNTQHLRSLSQLAQDTQRSFRHVADAIEALGIKPAFTLDGLKYYDADVVGLIKGYRPAAAKGRRRNDLHAVPATGGEYIAASRKGLR